MFIYWLIFACMTVIGSLTYNVSVKLASNSMHPFLFSMVISMVIVAVQIVAIGIARYGFQVDVLQLSNRHMLWFAALAGIGAAMVDVGFFLALRYGSPVASQAFWSIGGLIALALVSAAFFHESLTTSKLAGVVLGIASLYLLAR